MNALFARTLLVTTVGIAGVMVGCGRERNPPEALIPTHQGPTLSEISDQHIDEGGSKTVVFTVGDPDIPLDELRLSASSSNPAVVPTNNIVFGGLGAERRVSIRAAPYAFGVGTIIRINVSDGQSEINRSFRFDVYPVTGPPDLRGH